ncbi:MAG: nicotinate phosphoribosyltransferase [Micavibrio sp.]
MKALDQHIQDWTDTYFKNTKQVVNRNGDVQVTYAVFIRRPVVSAPRLMIEWLEMVARERDFKIEIELLYPEGKWVGAGEPLMYITGPLSQLCDLETLFLQKLGPACVAAYNAFTMCVTLPQVKFLAMDARHCAGTEMAEIMAYAASVGSARAKRKSNAAGFIGNATDATAHFFGNEKGMGTMPHALIGYAGSTLKAAQMFHETLPDTPMTVLIDYFGREISDSLEVARHFTDLAHSGNLSLRIDTPGSRYVEGLDPQKSYAVLESHVPDVIRGYRNHTELQHLIGTGVSAAALWHLRDQLDAAGFDKVRITGSSGFSPEKCRVMADAHAPLDFVGTGSYLPDKWPETYATADIIEYDGVPRVKLGREFLMRKKA